MKTLRRHDKLPLKGFACILLLWLAVACDTRTVYHEFRSLPASGWERGDTLTYEVQVTDSALAYRLFVEVRNSNSYPYRNLPLSLLREAPDSTGATLDTFQLMLADSTGIWRGTGWGGLYLSLFSCREVEILRPGIYRFKLVHRLPDDKLPGITDVGIRLER